MAYQELKIVDLSKIKPSEPITNVLVIGTEDANDFIDEIYFKVANKSTSFNCEGHSQSGYMRSVLPLRYLNDMSLYRTVVREKEKIIVFIEREYFEKLGEDKMNSIIQKKDLAEELRKVKIDPLNEYYLTQSIYYELTSGQYVTPAYLSEQKRKIKKLELLDCKIHYQPFVFRINRKQVLFLTREDLDIGTIRLLEIDSAGTLFELVRFQIDGCSQLLCKNLHSPTDPIVFHETIIEIDKIYSENKNAEM